MKNYFKYSLSALLLLCISCTTVSASFDFDSLDSLTYHPFAYLTEKHCATELDFGSEAIDWMNLSPYFSTRYHSTPHNVWVQNTTYGKANEEENMEIIWVWSEEKTMYERFNDAVNGNGSAVTWYVMYNGMNYTYSGDWFFTPYMGHVYQKFKLGNEDKLDVDWDDVSPYDDGWGDDDDDTWNDGSDNTGGNDNTGLGDDWSDDNSSSNSTDDGHFDDTGNDVIMDDDGNNDDDDYWNYPSFSVCDQHGDTAVGSCGVIPTLECGESVISSLDVGNSGYGIADVYLIDGSGFSDENYTIIVSSCSNNTDFDSRIGVGFSCPWNDCSAGEVARPDGHECEDASQADIGVPSRVVDMFFLTIDSEEMKDSYQYELTVTCQEGHYNYGDDDGDDDWTYPDGWWDDDFSSWADDYWNNDDSTQSWHFSYYGGCWGANCIRNKVDSYPEWGVGTDGGEDQPECAYVYADGDRELYSYVRTLFFIGFDATASPTTAPPTDAPTTAAPTSTPYPTMQPTISPAPTTGSPTTASPITASPTTASPITASPTTGSPTTGSPTTASPTTGSPTTASPTTGSPTTASPTVSTTTASPTTASPTDAPTTAPPTSTPYPTMPPTTTPPTTASPTSTPYPTTTPPTTASPTSASPTVSPTPSPTPEVLGSASTFNTAPITILIGLVSLLFIMF